MAWERRGNGLYYYQKKRDGDRVVSEYVGTGAAADLIADDRAKRKQQRAAWRRERDAELEIDREIGDLVDVVKTLTAAALLATGHHTHRGQWRKRRHGQC